MYREDSGVLTPLDWCVVIDSPPEVFTALLEHMEDEKVRVLGGKDVPAVRSIVQRTLDRMAGLSTAHFKWLGRAPHSERIQKQLKKSLQRLQTRS